MVSILNKQDIEDVFSHYYVVVPPKHVLVLDKQTVSIDGQGMGSPLQQGAGVQFYRGLQPSWRKDLIVVTPQGNDETLIHETLHAQLGAGEPLANLGGKLLVRKYRFIKRGEKTFVRGRVRLFSRRRVQYDECFGCEICSPQYVPEMNKYIILKMLSVPMGADAKHYIRRA